MRKILVATDGQEPAMGALRIALALAEQQAAEVGIVAVAERFPIIVPAAEEVTSATWREIELFGERQLRRRVEDQLAELGAGAVRWPLMVELGAPAATIVRLAHDHSASLIVMGLGRHKRSDRWFGTEMALRVMRLSHVPVLAVPSTCATLPRRVVAAVDFSEYGNDAARTAAELLTADGELHLVHVLWRAQPELPHFDGGEWLHRYESLAAQQLAELAKTLDPAAHLRIETHLLRGDPARETRRLAHRLEADLVAAGSHGTGFISRVLMGSVSTRLVRGATCSVLIAPPRTLVEEILSPVSSPSSAAAIPAYG